VLVAVAGAACGSAVIVDDGQGGASGGGGNGGGGGGNGGTAGSGSSPLIKLDANPNAEAGVDRPGGGNCGDGILERSEGCDDGNTESGDGCSRICQVENNYECKTPGQACVSIAICGNGHLTSDETCDDGNTQSGDGCSGDCQTIEKGYQCRVPGKPCTPKCGDGTISGTETCDDGNTKSDDGCSATCHLEIGWKCSGTPSQCAKTTCGDSKTEGAEGCDDGNTVPFDGCSAECQVEPNCSGSAGCTSKCGDGIVLNEDCDDGNAAGGDGCSKDCKLEPGWTCTQPQLGDKMLVPVVYRDFRYHNPTDFEAGVTGSNDPSPGVAKPDLDTEGKPVYTGTTGNAIHVESQDTFKKWYRDTSGVNHATATKMTLWNNGKGGYVNRYGANGEKWAVTKIAYWCGQVGQEKTDATTGKAIPCTFAQGTTECDTMDAQGLKQLDCFLDGTTYKAHYVVEEVDGNPLFFPVDGDNFTPASERQGAKIPPYYDATASWPFDVDAAGNKRLHNFSFTSEVRYWFKYESGKSYTLDFTGDDDVWVFVNKKLAVDLGGIHTPVNGTIVLNGNGGGTVTITPTLGDSCTTTNNVTTCKGKSSTVSLGMADKNVYEIAVFQAERQTEGSSYKLTLSGFNLAPTSCSPTCGDGVTVADEECDDGKDNSDDAYGGCTTQCQWGPFCGDGTVNGTEECDSGKENGAKYGEGGCSIGCTKPHFCGDGNVDTDRDEVCDLGDKNGQKLDSQLEPSSDPNAQVYCTKECDIPPGVVY
jgi:fibro-slime domain-containing protein